MALTNTGSQKPQGAAGATGAPVETKKVKGKTTSANEQMQAKGAQIIAEMTEEARAALGNKSGTLHFQYILGQASKKGSRRLRNGETKECPTAVGVCLVSDEEIEVPVIDIRKNKDTGIEAEDISYVKVEAGKPFNLSHYEFMYLIVRDEYAGFCEAEGNPRGIYFSPKLPAFISGKAKLPTPTINAKSGSVKASMVTIDEKGADDKWVIKEEYAEKFGALLEKKTVTRAGGQKSATTPAPILVAAALKNILGVK